MKSYQIESSDGKIFNPCVHEMIPQSHTWPCSLVMSAFIVANSDLISGKRVLEIGAGTGDFPFPLKIFSRF